MRYLKTENPFIWCRFTAGDSVTITIYKASDDSVVVNAAAMLPLVTTGYFKYQFNPSPIGLTEYFYIATNTIEEQAGKLILGGFPSDILEDTKELQENQINWLTAVGFAVPHEYDMPLAAIYSEVENIDGAPMRGSDGIPTNPLLANDGRLDNLDGTISSRASEVNATTNKDSLNTAITPKASEVNAITNRTILEAMLTPKATEVNATANKDELILEINANEAKIDAIAAAIGLLKDLSKGDVQDAMTDQGYTTLRAALLGYLDAAITDIPVEVNNALEVAHGAATWETADLSTVALETSLQLIKTETDKINAMVIVLEFIKDVEGGDWERLDVQQIFKKAGAGAEIARFNLFKSDGTPAQETDEDVAKRERV